MERLISVIVPVYNREKDIERCLISLMNQSLREIEILIINDGSTDRSEEIIKEIIKDDARFKLITQENKGLTYARNKGLDLSRGKYIYHLDGDDWIEKNGLKDMYDFAEVNNLDCVITNFIVDYEGNKENKIGIDYNCEDKDIFSGREYLKKFFKWEEIAPAIWNKLIKKSIYDKNRIKFPDNIFLGEDLATTPRLLYFCEKVGKLNNQYVHYMQHAGQGSNKNNLGHKIEDLFEVYKILNTFFKKYNEFKLELEESELNGLYIKFLKIEPKFENLSYNRAYDKFIEDIDKVLKFKSFKKIKLKDKIRIIVMSTTKSKWIFRKIISK